MSDLEAVVSRHRPERIVIAKPYRRGRLPLNLLLKLKVRDGVTLDEADAFYEKLTGKISPSACGSGDWFSPTPRAGRVSTGARAA